MGRLELTREDVTAGSEKGADKLQKSPGS